MALPLALATAEIINDRDQVLTAARQDILVMLDTIHGQAGKVFQFQALALGVTEDRLRGLSNEQIRAEAAAHHAVLRQLKSYASEQLGIAVFGSDGHVLVDSDRPDPPANVDVSAREYFLWHRDNPSPAPYVSGPARSLRDGSVIFFITRRRSAEDGSFLGVSAVIIEQQSLLNYWNQAAPDQLGLVSLAREDGRILARRPAAMGTGPDLRMLPQAPLSQAASVGAERTVVQGISPLDGVERLAAYRRLQQYPVNVIYGMPVDALLAPWRRRALVYGSFAALTAAALSALVVLARHRTRQLTDLNANLERRVRERTAEIEAGEARLRLLAREVDHRAKNALAVVQATLQLTPKDDLASYARAVEGRVAALSRAQTLLSKDHWRGANLQALLKAELEPFVSDGDGSFDTRAELDGPPVLLPPVAAQPLAMAVHELATNAVKHGALSSPGGRVTISWHPARREGEPGDTLLLRWAESGGPPVTGPPARRGFGSRVMASVVRGQLGGTLTKSWPSTGMVCDIAMPLFSPPAADRPDPSRAA